MSILYLTEQGAVIRKTGDRLVVEKEGKQLLEIECRVLEAVCVFGNVQFTTQALAEMLDHGIEFSLLTRSGRLRGQLTPPKAKNVLLRMEQYRKYEDQAFRLRQARSIVRAKLKNAGSVLRSYQQNHPELELDRSIEELERTGIGAGECQAIESLLGIEGTGARIYFSNLEKLLQGDWVFPGRKAHPSTDPVNALLSFGYVLVGNEISSLLDAIGFDPMIGFFHKLDYGRPSLALDLLEEFRHPFVDRLVLRLFNLRILQPEHFVTVENGAVYLNREGKKLFFPQYEKMMTQKNVVISNGKTSFRELFRRQAQRMARCLQEDEEYQPYVYRL